MTEDYPFGLSPGAQLIVTDQQLQDVINDVTKLMSPEQGLSMSMIDVLMVVATYTKQAKKAMQNVRLLYKIRSDNVGNK